MGRPKGSTNKVKKTVVKAEKPAAAKPSKTSVEQRQVANIADLAVEIVKLHRDVDSLAQAIQQFTSGFNQGIGQMSTAIENDMRNIDGRVKALEATVLPKTGDTRTPAETVAAATAAPKLAVVPPAPKEEEDPLSKVTNLL